MADKRTISNKECIHVDSVAFAQGREYPCLFFLSRNYLNVTKRENQYTTKPRGEGGNQFTICSFFLFPRNDDFLTCQCIYYNRYFVFHAVVSMIHRFNYTFSGVATPWSYGQRTKHHYTLAIRSRNRQVLDNGMNPI